MPPTPACPLVFDAPSADGKTYATKAADKGGVWSGTRGGGGVPSITTARSKTSTRRTTTSRPTDQNGTTVNMLDTTANTNLSSTANKVLLPL